MSNYELHHGDCVEVMAAMEDNSVDAIVTDPPYFKVKDEPWDRQWDKPEGFLRWLGIVLEQMHRVLKPNGSLYLFASPQMRARVELKVGEYFNTLPTVTWVKDAGWFAKTRKESLRSFTSRTEAIIFAEHYGADNIAKGEAGYVAKCDELRGFVFEPLRAYLDGERERAGLSRQDVAEHWRVHTGNSNRTGMVSHWFSSSQWALPTEKNYSWLREIFGNEYLSREYEELRTEYEDLRTEYETLRRPFNATPDAPYTDVWEFEAVQSYPGKHPCEKPQDMLRHMIEMSTRPGAVVLDPFAGSGATGEAAIATGRNPILIEQSEEWCDRIDARLRGSKQVERQPLRVKPPPQQGGLFAGM